MTTSLVNAPTVAAQDATALAQLLQQTLHPATQKSAEQMLAKAESEQAQMPLILMHLVQSDNASPEHQAVRFAAALYFKNYIRRHWPQHGDGQDKLTEPVRDAIKAGIVGLMISLPEKLQLQISDAVSTIAASDFPHHWESLMTDLVGRLSPTDYKVNAGVLQTAHSIFKRYRHEFRSTELYTEINFVLNSFCPAFLQLFKNTDELITAHANDANALNVLFQSILLMTKIFFSLNAQDIPAFFEDHQAEFMPLLLKYVVYSNPVLEGASDDEAGVVEKVKASICEIAELYAKKYEDVFPSLPQFVQTIWQLLTTVGLESKYDHLVSTAIAFLSTVAKHARHKPMFEAPDALKSICEKIILPNIQLRESDVELFEDDPIEFIRRDLEGSDSDTRRRAATDLVRSLSEQFEAPLTALFGGYVSHFLQKYSENPQANWKDKDTANFLLIAITAKSATAKLGAVQTNASINITDIFTSHVLPDLSAPVDAASLHPVLKVDALKFLNTFRHQLSKEQLLSVFPLIVTHLTSKNYVVHTYAAVCVERILSMKTDTHLMFTGDDIRPQTEFLLTNLFTLIEAAGETPEKISENDYLMKTVLRIVYIVRQGMVPYVTHILGRLTGVLAIISKNPSNPRFNHYLFESISSLIRFLCSADAKLVAQFEELLFPPIQAILQLDIPEFTPYVLQILAQLLEFHQEPGIPVAYQPLLAPLMSPVLWELNANVPALVRLLQAFLSHGGEYIVSHNHLQPFLGTFQKLIASRLNDNHGFDLLVSIVRYIPFASLSPYLKQVFNILLLRLHSSKTAKFTGGLLKFLCTFVCTIKEANGADLLVQTMDSIQPKLFQMVFQSILLAEVKQVTSPVDRKVCGVAMVRLLAECTSLATPDYMPIWTPMLDEVARVISSPVSKDASKPTSLAEEQEEELLAMDVEEAGYQSAFSRLHSIAKSQFDAAADVTDVRAFVAQKLGAVMQQPAAKQALAGVTVEHRQFYASLGIN